MKHLTTMLLATWLSLVLSSCSTPLNTTTEAKRPMFNPQPLSDDWSRWIVGEWEGSGESDTGQGTGVERIEFALHGQFLICRGEATITEISPEHAHYLKKNMHASDEEIERFKRTGYQSLQLFTVDQTTGEIIGYLFDSLRCIAQGRGKREGNREIMEWEWATGHKSTRITEKLSEDRMAVIQRTPMPDGGVMEEKGVSIRRKPRPSPSATRSISTPFSAEPKIIRHERFLVMGTLTRIAWGAESGETFRSIWSKFEAHREGIKTHSTDQKYYGITFAAGDEGGFDYLAGMAIRPVQAIPAGLVVREVPAATYAVFTCPVTAIGQTKRHIFGEWRSQSGYQVDNSAPAFEQYPPAEDTEAPVLIHIPIREGRRSEKDTAAP